MWKAAQKFLILHDERLCERATMPESLEHEMKTSLEDFHDFLPAAFMQQSTMARKTPSGEELRQAVRKRLESVEVSERDAFIEIWARADRVQSHTHW